MMSAAPASGMAFGLRSIGRRITMSAKGRGVIYEDITKTVHYNNFPAESDPA